MKRDGLVWPVVFGSRQRIFAAARGGDSSHNSVEAAVPKLAQAGSSLAGRTAEQAPAYNTELLKS